MKIGYVRVSTQEQSTLRQEVLMQSLGVEQLYIDKAAGYDGSFFAVMAIRKVFKSCSA